MELLPLNSNISQFMTLNRGTAFKLSSETEPMPLNTVTVGKDIDIKRNELKKAAEGFEAIFVRQMLQAMRSGLENNLFGSGSSGGIYAEIADQAVSEAMASRGTLGIADNLYDSLIKRVELSETM